MIFLSRSRDPSHELRAARNVDALDQLQESAVGNRLVHTKVGTLNVGDPVETGSRLIVQRCGRA